MPTVRKVSTLDPLKLTLDDRVDIRGLGAPNLRFAETTKGCTLMYDRRRERDRLHYIPWPSSARGFFYFHRPSTPTVHPAAGSLRFRSVESSSHFRSAFDASAPPSLGFDIPLDRGGYVVPWSIPLLTLSQTSHYSAIWWRLEADGLVTRRLLEDIKTLLRGYKMSFRKGLRVLEDVTQPWILNLDHDGIRFMVLAKDKIHPLPMRNLSMTQMGRRYVNGKQGVAWVRFELDERRKLVLRVLKYLIPPSSAMLDANLGQQGGELLLQHQRASGLNLPGSWLPPKPWSIDPQQLLSPASIAALTRKYA
ncbi:hypothetical protein BKA70DRAFT_1437764 [Coprinopsis sp. MPI-PUGE-AT-0042]|nr:hypothetical protein BKA70DRAFT_1437764 [Coprinopsis sp. MPI-PUGE-AT-0042]